MMNEPGALTPAQIERRMRNAIALAEKAQGSYMIARAARRYSGRNIESAVEASRRRSAEKHYRAMTEFAYANSVDVPAFIARHGIQLIALHWLAMSATA